MKILVRLPNWLGDVVMSAAFIEQLCIVYPGSEISVIVKKGLDKLLVFFPPLKNIFIFSKEEFKGIAGAHRFGRKIKTREKYDMFFCLPDSFSSALMGFATGTKIRIGYKNEFRSFLLTHSYHKNKQHHRVEQYVEMLGFFSGKKIEIQNIIFQCGPQKEDNIIININSEASSRRLPKEKAVSIINNIRNNTTGKILLIGSGNEKSFVDEVFSALANKTNIENIAGSTTLPGLAAIMCSAKIVLTTDSGPAHLANALGVQTIILFGAGNENITAPYNENKTIIRLGKLTCEPCGNNICKRYGVPKCLTLLNEEQITKEVRKYLD